MTTLRTLLLLAFLGISSVAFADAFDDAYDAGSALFTQKEYAKARAEFQKAYDLRPEPIVLYNIAQTYRFENNGKQAIEYYKRYLADSKSAEDLRKKAEGYITDLENAAKKAEEDRKKAEANGPKNPDGTPVQVDTPPRTVTPANPSNPVAPQQDVVRHRTIPLGSKIAAGVTGAGLIASLVFTKIGLSAEKDFKDDRAAGTATQAQADKVARDQNLINISWGITGAAAVTAVVIYFVAPSYTTDTKTIAVIPTRDGAIAAFSRRF